MTLEASPARAITSRRLKVAAVAAIAVAVVVVAYGIASRAADESRLKQWTDAQAIPSVTVIQPTAGDADESIVLPGRLEAYYRAPIYARVSGYLKSWSTDIGARVKAGQVLGLIETPDLDQQLEQGKADLASARANQALAETTARRWQAMLKSDSVSQQAVDEKTGDLAAKQAIANAAAANVERLQALEGFKRIVAPFDGVVTSRDTDVGALIDAGGGRGPQLFTVSDIHQLRVYVRVPQDDAPAIHPGMTAELSVPGHAGSTYIAKVDSSAGAVNAESGTLLVELSLDDSSGALMPGDFANVRFAVPAAAGLVRVPASALIFRTAGLQVATVDADSHARLHTITIRHDLGRWVEVASGISPGDRIIDSPPDALSDGDEVHAMPAASNAPAATAAAQQGAGNGPD
jgi:RND family efflux transporter MFP subunit